MPKKNDLIVFNGKNFESIIKKFPRGEGEFFIVGLKGKERAPLSMCRIRNKRFEERKECMRKKFLNDLMMEGEKVERKEYLERMMEKFGFDKILVELSF